MAFEGLHRKVLAFFQNMGQPTMRRTIPATMKIAWIALATQPSITISFGSPNPIRKRPSKIPISPPIMNSSPHIPNAFSRGVKTPISPTRTNNPPSIHMGSRACLIRSLTSIHETERQCLELDFLQERLFDSLREFCENKVFGRVKVIFAALVHYPKITVCLSVFIG